VSIGDTIASGVERIELAIVGAILFVVGDYIMSASFNALTQSMVSMHSPLYVWALIVAVYGGLLISEIKAVLVGGLLFSGTVVYLATQMHDWPSLAVVGAAWGCYAGFKYLTRG